MVRNVKEISDLFISAQFLTVLNILQQIFVDNFMHVHTSMYQALFLSHFPDVILCFYICRKVQTDGGKES